MIIVKEEFTAGAFDLPYVKIYSNTTNKLKDTKTNKIYTATEEKPLTVERYRLNSIEEIE
jgi:hypothetical protein